MKTTTSPSTKQDILQYLLQQGQANAHQLAEALNISPQAIRRHLTELEAEGLIVHHPVQSGMGRPQHLYELSALGRDRFPTRYDEFAVSFLDTLAETMGEKQVSEVLRKQWEKKGQIYRHRVGFGSLKARLNNLVKMRQEEGYMVQLHYLESEGKFIYLEHNCVISEVAQSYPSVCGHELEMFAAVLPDCTVERTHWINGGEHRCGYSIEKKI